MIVDDEDIIEEGGEQNLEQGGEVQKTISLSGMYKDWFLDYASYVILERAVPHLNDGLKPVQRRILHSMRELDDGRYNKVANIIGHTMKYHPHGDASIGDALVQLGQKDLLIDCQGNWGNVYTGDSAAAPRYIEARLSKFANDVVFNPKTTKWQLSYDGRNKEPVTLPVKFPLLLAQGVEGIAVGLASKILPHNFNELIDASINWLKGQETEIFPDFMTGGMIDVSRYNDGLRGGKVRIRSRISQLDKKTLVIKEIPFGITTTQLIDSVLVANEKGKIKIRKIEDNTAENVEILIHLNPNVSPDLTIDALYAFTDCEISVSPNSCVIENDKPRFLGVKEMLKIATDNTVKLLKKELEIRKAELEEAWHFASLEKIFIQKEIYLKIRTCTTWESVIETIDKGLKPYKKLFKREITRDDIIRLTEIRIKRISKYDSFRADEEIKNIEVDIDEVKNNLKHLIDYTIYYYKQIKKKYGQGRERKTEIRNFDTIEATMVAAATQKLYVNREEGFAGTGLKKDEYLSDCSDIDDIIVFRRDGTYMITKVAEKVFVGKDPLHIAVFKRNDSRTIYNVVYQDGLRGNAMVKRFAVESVIRDKEYTVTKGTAESKVLYFTANPNGEAETITVNLVPKPKLRKLNFDFDFSTLAVKGRNSQGNRLSKYRVRKITLKGEGVSTLSARKIWFDDTVMRLNAEERGKYLGEFSGEDKIISITRSGFYRLTGFDLATHFDEDQVFIEKFRPEKNYTAIYLDGETNQYYIKRFQVETTDKKVGFISEHPESKLELITNQSLPEIELEFKKVKGVQRPNEKILCNDFIAVKGYKAKGKRLTIYEVNEITLKSVELEIHDTELISETNREIDIVNEELAMNDESEVKEEKVEARKDKGKVKPVKEEVNTEKTKLKAEEKPLKMIPKADKSKTKPEKEKPSNKKDTQVKKEVKAEMKSVKTQPKPPAGTSVKSGKSQSAKETTKPANKNKRRGDDFQMTLF